MAGGVQDEANLPFIICLNNSNIVVVVVNKKRLSKVVSP
jgi:hypothetical protein